MNQEMSVNLRGANAYALCYDEAREQLARLASLCDGRCTQPEKNQLVRTQGDMPSLKGTAHALGLSEVVRLSHAVEAVLQRLIYQELACSEELARLLSRSCLEMRRLLMPSVGPGLGVPGQGAPASARLQEAPHRQVLWRVRLRIAKKQADHPVDALLHLVRNACDHGIETADVRLQSGKPAHGSLRLEVTEHQRWLRVRFSDDGRGLDNAASWPKPVKWA